MTDDEWNEERDDDKESDKESNELQDEVPDDFDWDEFDPNPDEEELDDWEGFDPNPDENELSDWDDFDPNPDEDELEEWGDFDPNSEDGEDHDEWDEFDPNTDDDETDEWADFDPNPEHEEEINDFNPTDQEDEVTEDSEFKDEDEIKEFENVDTQSTVQVQDDQEMGKEEGEEEMQDYENVDDSEILLPDPEEYEQFQDPITDVDEAEFIRDMQDLSKALDLEREDDTAYNAEQAYEKMHENKEDLESIPNDHEEEENLSEFDEERTGIHADEVEDGLPKELRDQEELDFLMEKFEEYLNEGLSPEEISEIMQEAEQLYEKLRDMNTNYVPIDDLDKDESEGYQEEIVNEHQIQELRDEVDELSKEGLSPEDIEQQFGIEEKINMLKEDIQEEQESLKDVDHDDEEDVGDFKEEPINTYQSQEVMSEVEEMITERRSSEKIEYEPERKETIERETRKSLKNGDHWDEEKEEKVVEEEDYPEEFVDEESANDIIEDVNVQMVEGISTEKTKVLFQKEEILEEFSEIVEKFNEEYAGDMDQYLSRKESQKTEEDEDYEQELERFEQIRELTEHKNDNSVQKHELQNTTVNDSNLDQNSADYMNEKEDLMFEDKESRELDNLEELKREYRETTGRNPIYAKKHTKGFQKWLSEILNAREKKEQPSELKNWQECLLKWIDECPEEEMSNELKNILSEIICKSENYEHLRNLFSTFLMLYDKFNANAASDKEMKILHSIVRTLNNVGWKSLSLYENVRNFKTYYEEHEVWNSQRIEYIKKAFLTHLAKKNEFLKQISKTGRKNPVNVKFLRNENGNEIPYIDIGKDVLNLRPLDFKRTFKGIYSHFFKYVKERHNKYMSIKSIARLIKKPHYGVVYRITQIRDEMGIIVSGPSIILTTKVIETGKVRIGIAKDLKKRLRIYDREAKGNPEYHFERALQKYGWKSFKFEILAICKSQREYEATEIFWQLYFNRVPSSVGYNLSENDRFNLIIGGRGTNKYYFPMWEITDLIMKGLKKLDIENYYCRKYFVSQIDRSVLNKYLINYFGTNNLEEIQMKLVTPLIDYSLNHDFSHKECLEYIKNSGIKIYSKGNEAWGMTKFVKHLKTIYRSSGIKFDKFQIPYNQIFLDVYIKQYIVYLKSNGVHSPMEDLLIKGVGRERELDSLGRFIGSLFKFIKDDYDKWGIIEHLLVKDLSTRQISIVLDLCQSEDPDNVKDSARGRVEGYLETKYRNRFDDYSLQKLITFLKSKKI